MNIISHQDGFPPQRPQKRKNKEYITNLDQRLASAKLQINKAQKLKIKEREINNVTQDRPLLSEGTKKLTENMSVKNVFQRQKMLMHAQKKLKSRHLDKDRYNKINGITNGPHINQKSKNLHRTIDDLYQWHQRKINKLEAER